MGFFDELSNKSALSSKINKLSATINANYSELGVRYYNLYKDNPDPKFKELIDTITAAYADIAKTEEQLAYLRGFVICPGCKSECSAELKFCVKCGTKLIKPVPETPVAQPVPVQPAAPAVSQSITQPAAPAVSQPIAPPAPVQAAAPQTTTPAASEFKFCTECGNKVSVNAMFCTECGKSFNK